MPLRRSIARWLAAGVATLFFVAPFLGVGGPARAAPAPPAAVDQGPVRVVFFHARWCSDCRRVEEEVVGPLEARWGDRIEVRRLDVAEEDNQAALDALDARDEVSALEGGVPTLLVGDAVLRDVEAIPERLPALVETLVAEGGSPWPTIPGPAGVDDAGDAPPGAERTDASASGDAVWLAFVHQPGCRACARVRAHLDTLVARHPSVRVDEIDVYEELPLALELAKDAGLDDVSVPAVYFRGELRMDEARLDVDALEAWVRPHLAGGSARSWDRGVAEAGASDLVARFRDLGPIAVMAAGLIDGINPCAFTTLVLFVSYLAISGRKGSEILAVGAAFTLAVFLSYLAVGLGMHRLLAMMGDTLTVAGRWLLGLTAVVCALFAILSFRDFLMARGGRPEESVLKLPDALQKRVRQTIREGRRSERFVVGAFLTGVVVSFLELACTGQVYLPTIIFVTAVPELRAQAVGYLVLYNVLFVLPLIVVFVLAWRGAKSDRIARFARDNVAPTKLALAVLFLALAAWLGISALPTVS